MKKKTKVLLFGGGFFMFIISVFVLPNIVQAIEKDISAFGLFVIFQVLANEESRNLWLQLHLIPVGIILWLLMSLNWRPEMETGNGQHGTAKWARKEELENHFKTGSLKGE